MNTNRSNASLPNGPRPLPATVSRMPGPSSLQMRLVKSPMELRIMQHAIDISIEAHQRAWAAAGNAKWEYEVDAEVAYTFKLRNADNWGYPDIVGCGPNATTLHYNRVAGTGEAGELLLMDVGAEYDHYTADITRTFPVNGKFTPDAGRCSIRLFTTRRKQWRKHRSPARLCQT